MSWEDLFVLKTSTILHIRLTVGQKERSSRDEISRDEFSLLKLILNFETGINLKCQNTNKRIHQLHTSYGTFQLIEERVPVVFPSSLVLSQLPVSILLSLHQTIQCRTSRPVVSSPSILRYPSWVGQGHIYLLGESVSSGPRKIPRFENHWTSIFGTYTQD